MEPSVKEPSGARVRSSTVWGVLLLLAGVVLLLDAFGLVAGSELFWTGVFAVAAAVFVALFVTARERWWAAIPAGGLAGLAAVTAWEGVAGGEEVGGALFLGFSAAGFWAVYARSPHRWWAVIPGGAGLTLALVAALFGAVGESAAVATFLLGLALTFVAVALLPAGGARTRWALVPAGVLGLLGVLFGLQATAALELFTYAWPIALIAVGAYLLWRAVSGRHRRPPMAPGV
jgi:hypothetical protein